MGHIYFGLKLGLDFYRLRLVHPNLEKATSFRRSYFVIIIKKNINKSSSSKQLLDNFTIVGIKFRKYVFMKAYCWNHFFQLRSFSYRILEKSSEQPWLFTNSKSQAISFP